MDYKKMNEKELKETLKNLNANFVEMIVLMNENNVSKEEIKKYAELAKERFEEINAELARRVA